MRDKKNILILIIAAAVLILPFIAKPFNVDDPFYIKMARHLTVDPAMPYSFSINWSGHLRDVWKDVEATFPPLIPYFIALLIKIFGQNEKAFHICFFIFPVTAIISSYFVAKKFTDQPLISALLVLASPSFLVSATGIMLDVPLLSLMTFSLALIIYGTDNRKIYYLLVGSLFLGFTVLTKYSAVILFPVILYYFYRKNEYRDSLILFVPIVMFGLWCAWNLWSYGEIHIYKSALQVGKGISFHKLLAVISFFSGVMVFPVFAMFGTAIRKTKIFVLIVFSMLTAAIFLFTTPGEILYFSILSVSSICFMYEIFSRRREYDIFVLIWFFISAVFVLFAEPWAAGRYFLVLLLPSAIIFTKLAGKKTMFAALAFSMIVSTSVTYADYVWAKGYREISSYFSKNYKGAYFSGHMGFQYYMEQNGFRPLEVDNDIKQSYLILSKIPDPQFPGKTTMARARFCEYKEIKSRFPLRIMNYAAKAGFYSSFWGIFPYAVSSEPLDKFAVYWID